MITGDSILVGPNNGLLHLRGVIAGEMPTAMVTPLTIDGEHFGALVSIREQPFEQHDLSSLTRFARYIAPWLSAVVKRRMMRAGI